MDHPDHAAHAAIESPFTPAEVTALHRADWAAARNIVCLMLGIFITGLCLYLAVDYYAYTEGHERVETFDILRASQKIQTENVEKVEPETPEQPKPKS